MVIYGELWWFLGWFMEDWWMSLSWIYEKKRFDMIWSISYWEKYRTLWPTASFFCGWSAKCKPSLLDGPLGQLQQRFSCGAGHVKQKQRASIIKNTAYESSQTNKHKMICDEGFRPLVFVFPDIEQGGLLCCPKLWRWLKSLQILES